ncbi:MAG: DUF4349 domain-containing protein [Iodobacter sp.]
MPYFLLLLFCLLTACSGKSDEQGSVLPSSPANGAKLAYQHSIQIETANVSTVFASAERLCQEAAAEQCMILESRLRSGRNINASLKLRAKPAAVRKLISRLGQQSNITDQSTTAEDLAAPLADSSKKLAMLQDYRSKLESLRQSAKKDIDALIKVNHELAQAQSDLETLSGEHARLMQRVETEILNISVRTGREGGFWSPVLYSLSDFGHHLSEGLSFAITGTAYLLPWLLMLLVIIWSGRKLWRRFKRPQEPR